MRRHELIGLLGGAATWPFAVRAQTRPVVGVLGSVSSKTFKAHFEGFLEGFKESGFVDGSNVTVEYRWAEGKFDQTAGAGGRVGSPYR